MLTLTGRGEEGGEREITFTPLTGGVLRVQGTHPGGRRGPPIHVDAAAFRQALQAGHPVPLPGLGGHKGNPMLVERRGADFYLWIQNVGKNGWSIHVRAAELERTLAAL